MVDGRPERDRHAALHDLDERLQREPDPALVLDRARLLIELDRIDEARAAYLAALARDPDDLRALGDFGSLLMQTGHRAAARTVYERALALAPDDPQAHVHVANALFADGAFAQAHERYAAALAVDPRCAAAHQGISYALVRLGRDDEARRHRAIGFAGRAVTTGSYRGAGAPVDVLVLVAAAGGTTYTDNILDDRVFRTTTLVADAFDEAQPLPAGDVVFNAISDADRAATELRAMDRVLARDGRTAINPPAAVLRTGRAENAARLGRLDGVLAPRVAGVARAALTAPDGPDVLARAGLAFPLLLRAPGFHTGQHFVRVDTPGELAAAAGGLPGADVLAIAFADLRDARGAVRKFRVMFVDGVLYPLHLAVGTHWKVHYFSAGMDADAAARAEDEAFLADPARVLGAGAVAALHRIRDAIGLEYFGVDFGLAADGRVVVFEANATMIVLPPGTEPIWAYRREPVQRVIDAVQRLVRDRGSRFGVQ